MFSPGTQCQNLVEFLDTSVSLGKLLMWRIAGRCGENLHTFGAQQEVVCMSSKEDSQERRTQWGRAMFFQKVEDGGFSMRPSTYHFHEFTYEDRMQCRLI